VEAVRAVAAAQPFLEKAKEVYLITVSDDYRARQSLQDAEQYLQLHYANVQSEILSPSSENIGETLLGYARAKGNAMLVMGAYSHWRWRELVFGGATEHALRNANVPLLMAH
jgi:nucleotide-binding universal stress UspA family protein